MADPNIQDVLNRLQSMDNRLAHVEGNVNVLAHISKSQNREALRAEFEEALGSLQMQRLWYYATKPSDASTLARQARVPESNARKYVQRLAERGLLRRHEVGSRAMFLRNELSKGLGLEEFVKTQHQKANEPLQAPASEGAAAEGPGSPL